MATKWLTMGEEGLQLLRDIRELLVSSCSIQMGILTAQQKIAEALGEPFEVFVDEVKE